MSKGKYYFSKSLEKGLKILTLFNRETPVLTQSQIAKTLGLNMTSTYRYINTLVELGYLEKDRKTREIRTSRLCMLLCANLMGSTDHLRMIREVVDRIHDAENISIDVVLVVDDAIVHIYHREAQETLTYHLPDYSKNCLHNTALGKAYLASLPDDQIALKLNTLNLVAKTEKTIVDKALLAKELQEIKARHFAIAEEEYLRGLIAIGAPLYDFISGNGIGAVSFDFSILQNSARDIEAKYSSLIKETAKTISEVLLPDINRR